MISSNEYRLKKTARATRPMLGTAFPPDDGERDAVLACFQAWIDAGLASWGVNEAGGTELHLANGNAFLLQDDGIVRLR